MKSSKSFFSGLSLKQMNNRTFSYSFFYEYIFFRSLNQIGISLMEKPKNSKKFETTDKENLQKMGIHFEEMMIIDLFSISFLTKSQAADHLGKIFEKKLFSTF